MHEARLLLELGGVLFALGLLARFAGRIGLSPIPLYLLGGLAFGHGGVAALGSSEGFISAGADVGVVLLLLVLGIEYSSSELVDSLRRQAPAGVLDLALNATPGAVAGLALGWGPVGALTLAGVTAVSSSGIVAKVLADLGRLGNRETPSILGVLVLEDLAMAVYLPILTIVFAAQGLSAALRSVTVALAVLAAVLLVATRYGDHVGRLVFSESSEVLVLQVVGLALLVAGVAQATHVSAAVGAFLLGIALSDEVAEHSQALLAPLRDLFAAAFFVFFGLSTDPVDLPPVLVPALLLAVCGVATKFASGWYAARRAGVAVPGRIRAGVALAPRGEFSIVIAGLAVSAGAVNGRIGPLAAAYVLLLAVIGPLLPRLSDPLTRRVMARRSRAA